MAIDPVTGLAYPAEYYDNHSVQALIELAYVRTANETLASNMASLESALTTTKDIMDTLTGLQNLHNKITVPEKQTFEQATGFSYASGSKASYAIAASAYFNAQINPTFSLVEGSPAQIAFTNDLLALRAKLSGAIPLLSATTPRLASDLGGGEDPNSLLAKIRTVLNDMPHTSAYTVPGHYSTFLFTHPFTGTKILISVYVSAVYYPSVSGSSYALQKQWVEDNYSALTGQGSLNAGNIQQNLTFAITAGESLNDTQKETVRRYLFLFEEYYKSASAILQKISQLIEKMAQSISR